MPQTLGLCDGLRLGDCFGAFLSVVALRAKKGSLEIEVMRVGPMHQVAEKIAESGLAIGVSGRKAVSAVAACRTLARLAVVMLKFLSVFD